MAPPRMTRPPNLIRDDRNEEQCGACGKGGDLICCERCPAAFHAPCAGYREPPPTPAPTRGSPCFLGPLHGAAEAAYVHPPRPDKRPVA